MSHQLPQESSSLFTAFEAEPIGKNLLKLFILYDIFKMIFITIIYNSERYKQFIDKLVKSYKPSLSRWRYKCNIQKLS
jgi:hypothetical protein